MKLFTEKLYAELQAALEEIKKDNVPELQQCEMAVSTVTEKLKKLKEYILAYEFADIEEEIRFFKETKPMFLLELLYYRRLFEIEAKKPLDRLELENYYRSHIGQIKLYFENNAFLHIYYQTNKTFLDAELFVRQPRDVPFFQEYNLESDNNFSNIYSYKLSKIRAFEYLSAHLLSHLNILEKGTSALIPPEFDKLKKVFWQGNKASFYEVVLSLVESGLISGDIKTAMEFLGFCLGLKPGNYYGYFQSMRIRKKNIAPVLDLMKTSLIKRFDETDEHPRFH